MRLFLTHSGEALIFVGSIAVCVRENASGAGISPRITVSSRLRQTAGGVGTKYWLLSKDIPAMKIVFVFQWEVS